MNSALILEVRRRYSLSVDIWTIFKLVSLRLVSSFILKYPGCNI
jgi:hypothetical protein